MPPHTHPYSEVVTVISGNIGTSHGEKFEKKGELLKPGSLGFIRQSTLTTPGPETRREFSKSSSSVLGASITSTQQMIRGNSNHGPDSASNCYSQKLLSIADEMMNKDAVRCSA